MPAWDDHKYVRPEPGSSWTILPGGAALFTVTPQVGSQWDVSDRAGRQLGLVAPAYGADFAPNETDILTELRQIRIALAFLVQEFGGSLAELSEGVDEGEVAVAS